MIRTDPAEIARTLRRSLPAITDASALIVGETIADYLESTADDLSRVAFAEVAMAYAEGYEHGRTDGVRAGDELARDGRRQLWRALRSAGLAR